MTTMKSDQASAALGAAILAGKAVGLFDSIETAVENMAQVKDTYSPDSENRQVYEKGYELYKKLFRDLNECFETTL